MHYSGVWKSCSGSELESESSELLYCVNDVSSSSLLELSEDELSGLLIFALDDGGVEVCCSVAELLFVFGEHVLMVWGLEKEWRKFPVLLLFLSPSAAVWCGCILRGQT